MTGRLAGFTLIEMLIALALFALVSVAGLGLVQAVLGAQARTQGRLERLADLQRTMLLMSRDLEQVSEAPIVVQAGRIGFVRHSVRGEDLPISYRLRGGELDRTLGAGSEERTQLLLDHVAALRFGFHVSPGGWTSSWPPPGTASSARPDALAVDLALEPAAGMPGGTVRRLVALPERP